MGTKTKPGKFDCYSAAKVDEPMFVLLGRDPLAPFLVAIWAEIRAQMGEEKDKVEEALQTGRAMRDYCAKLGKQEKLEKVYEILNELLAEGGNEGLLISPTDDPDTYHG